MRWLAGFRPSKTCSIGWRSSPGGSPAARCEANRQALLVACDISPHHFFVLATNNSLVRVVHRPSGAMGEASASGDAVMRAINNLLGDKAFDAWLHQRVLTVGQEVSRLYEKGEYGHE